MDEFMKSMIGLLLLPFIIIGALIGLSWLGIKVGFEAATEWMSK